MIRIIVQEFVTTPDGSSTKTYQTIPVESKELEELLSSSHGYYLPTVIGATVEESTK